MQIKILYLLLRHNKTHMAFWIKIYITMGFSLFLLLSFFFLFIFNEMHIEGLFLFIRKPKRHPFYIHLLCNRIYSIIKDFFMPNRLFLCLQFYLYTRIKDICRVAYFKRLVWTFYLTLIRKSTIHTPPKFHAILEVH